MKWAWLLPSSFGLSWLVTRLILLRAERWQLLQPPNHRSSHVLPTPNGGGLGIVLATLLSGAWLAWRESSDIYSLLALSLPLACMGLLDDVRHLSAKLRLAVQLTVVIGFLNLRGAYDFPPLLLCPGVSVDGGLLLGSLLLAGTWWINLFNFMDGIDGLAGIQAIFMLLGGGCLAAWMNPGVTVNPAWVLMLCAAAATMGFLLLNWSPAKIFMGNVGSTWFGFVIFGLALMSVQGGWLSYSTWLVLAALFVTDATITLLVRIQRGERWYEAHRSHAYQRLSRRWRGDRNAGHRAVAVLAGVINLLWLGPLALATLLLPAYAWIWLSMAYLPVIAAAIWLGAGKPDNA